MHPTARGPSCQIVPLVLAFLLTGAAAAAPQESAQPNPQPAPATVVAQPSPAPVAPQAQTTAPANQTIAGLPVDESLTRIMGVVMLAVAVFFLILLTVELRNGGPVSIDSAWGGFGGSLGGWRLSPGLVYLLIVIIFGAMSAMTLSPRVSTPPPGTGQTVRTERAATIPPANTAPANTTPPANTAPAN